MATIAVSSGRHFPAIDPNAEPPVRELSGTGILEHGLPHPSRATARVYGGLSDTFIVRYGDTSRPVIVTECIDEFCILLDPETEEFAGIQAENFMTVLI